ncbi:hypothetical protein [Variovorax sp. V213]|uniref:hypothetical protein n=1 Tax=Variovorax sp. V213 TaxID=3065955 RepID=UPI0034E8D035
MKQFLDKCYGAFYLGALAHGHQAARDVDSQFQQGAPMKKTAATLMFAFAISLLMSGCVVPVYEGGGGQKGGNFCPPGQAKKGNC